MLGSHVRFLLVTSEFRWSTRGKAEQSAAHFAWSHQNNQKWSCIAIFDGTIPICLGEIPILLSYMSIFVHAIPIFGYIPPVFIFSCFFGVMSMIFYPLVNDHFRISSLPELFFGSFGGYHGYPKICGSRRSHPPGCQMPGTLSWRSPCWASAARSQVCQWQGLPGSAGCCSALGRMGLNSWENKEDWTNLGTDQLNFRFD